MVVVMVVITWVIFLFSANSGLGSYLANRPPWLMDVFFGLGIFLIFSMIAYSAQSPRFCLYGLLLGISLPASVIIRSEDQMMVAYPTNGCRGSDGYDWYCNAGTVYQGLSGLNARGIGKT